MNFLESMNDTIRVVVESNEERFTKLIKNFTDIQSVAEGMEQIFSEISLNFTEINDKIGNNNENCKLGS